MLFLGKVNPNMVILARESRGVGDKKRVALLYTV